MPNQSNATHCTAPQPYAVDPNDKSVGAHFRRFQNWCLKGVTKDVHEDIKGDDELMAMHDDAEHFQPETEQVFKYLQVSCSWRAAGWLTGYKLKGRLMLNMCSVWMCLDAFNILVVFIQTV